MPRDVCPSLALGLWIMVMPCVALSVETEDQLGFGNLHSPTGTVEGSLPIAADVQDPDGLMEVWVTLVEGGPKLFLCDSGVDHPCEGDVGHYSLDGGDPSALGAGPGEVTARLYIRDQLGNVLEVANRVFFVSQEEDANRARLTLIKEGTGDGLLEATSVGVSCDEGCQEQSVDVIRGTVVEIRALGDEFIYFNGEACVGRDACQVTVSHDLEVRARFEALPDLSVASTGPIPNVTDVDTGSNVRIHFTRPIQFGPSHPDIQFRVLNGETIQFQSTIYPTAQNTLVLNPSGLAAGKEYEVVLPADAVLTSDGLALEEEYRLRFTTTEDGMPRIFLGAFPEYWAEGRESHIDVWFDAPADVEREVIIRQTPEGILQLPQEPLVFAPGEVVKELEVTSLGVTEDTPVALEAMNTNSGRTGANLLIGDTTPQPGLAIHLDTFSIIEDDNDDGRLQAGEDARVNVRICNEGDFDVPNVEVCLSVVNARTWDLRPTTPCKMFGFFSPDICRERDFRLRSDSELPSDEYFVRIVGSSEVDEFTAYASVDVENEALPDYELYSPPRGRIILEPGEMVFQTYAGHNRGDGTSVDLPEVLFTVEDEAGTVVLERRSLIDVRRGSDISFPLALEAPAISGTYTVRGTINPPSVGLSESDYSNNDADDFSFIVNRGLELEPLGGLYVVEAGDSFQLSVEAMDLDDDPLEFELIQAPFGMELVDVEDSAAVVAWTPSESQGPAAYQVELEVIDGFGHSMRDSFTINVRRRADVKVDAFAPSLAIVPGLEFVHRVQVSHQGPTPKVDATLQYVASPEWVDLGWSCTATPGSSCAESGVGGLDGSPLSLSHGGSATYWVRSMVRSGSIGIAQYALCVDPDSPVSDPVESNNCDSVHVTLSALDFGDAPDRTLGEEWSFPVQMVDDGARHGVGLLRLGTGIDGEENGLVSWDSGGDDAWGDDEDGVTFSELIAGATAEVSVRSTGTGLLSAWFDWNSDGDWLDEGEQSFTDQPLTAGVNPPLQLEVPAEAEPGRLMARFRLSTQQGLQSYGVAYDGEVEDFQLEVLAGFADMELNVSPAEASVEEPSGNVRLTLSVVNQGNLPITLIALTDPVAGNLNGQGTCVLPQPLDVHEEYLCVYDAVIHGNAEDEVERAISAASTSAAGNLQAEASTTITVLDVLPSLGVVLKASPDELQPPGGDVLLTTSVANTGAAEDVLLEALHENIEGTLSGRGNCALPQILGPATTYTCQYTAHVTGASGEAETRVVTAIGQDDEENSSQGVDSAVISIQDTIVDISAQKSNGRNFVVPGGQIAYRIQIENQSLVDVPGIFVFDPLPAPLEHCHWTCQAERGSCDPRGDGDIRETIDLLSEGSVEIDLTCQVEEQASGWLMNTVYVELPQGYSDVSSLDNSASDVTEITTPLFVDGFESGDVSGWSTNTQDK